MRKTELFKDTYMKNNQEIFVEISRVVYVSDSRFLLHEEYRKPLCLCSAPAVSKMTEMLTQYVLNVLQQPVVTDSCVVQRNPELKLFKCQQISTNAQKTMEAASMNA